MKTFSKTVIGAISGSLLLAGCAYFKPDPNANKENEGGPSRCELLAMIEDGEDANSQILTREGRGGYIYTYVDGTGSKVSPKGNFMVSRGGVGDSKFVLRMKGELSGAAEVYAGLGFGLSDQGPDAPYDASKYKGIAFIAKRAPDTAAAIRFKAPDVNTDPKGGICKECHNDFGTTIKLTEDWTRYVIFFDDMKQETGWGDPSPEKVDVSALIGLTWQIAIPNSKFDIYVDDISFIGACGEDIPVEPQAEEAAAPEPAPAPEAPAVEAAPEAADQATESETAPAAVEASAN